jgi:hypothetical protein
MTEKCRIELLVEPIDNIDTMIDRFSFSDVFDSAFIVTLASMDVVDSGFEFILGCSLIDPPVKRNNLLIDIVDPALNVTLDQASDAEHKSADSERGGHHRAPLYGLSNGDFIGQSPERFGNLDLTLANGSNFRPDDGKGRFGYNALIGRTLQRETKCFIFGQFPYVSKRIQ